MNLGKHILILLSFCFGCMGLFAQQGNNPFELPGRITPTEKVDQPTNLPDTTPSTQPSTQNPFEIKNDSTYLILYAFSLILIGTFLFVVLTHYKIAFFSAPILNLLGCVGGVFAIFIIKHVALQILGSIFPISKEIEQYSFTIIIFGIIIGFFLLPAILLISYAPPNLTTTVIYGTFIAIGMVYLYRILRSLFIGLKYISLHKFHFFVYLCTIEIAPLLVLAKLIIVP